MPRIAHLTENTAAKPIEILIINSEVPTQSRCFRFSAPPKAQPKSQCFRLSALPLGQPKKNSSASM